MKKLVALVLALAMIMMVAVASANTITVTGAVNGETYNIYKMLDLEKDNTASPNTAFTYTINLDWEGFWTGTGAGAAYIDTNTVGSKTYVVWKSGMDTAAHMEAFAKAAAAFAADNSKTPAATAITADASTPVSFTVDDGYYLVTSTLGIAATVFSTPANTTQEMREKNSTSTSDKDVKEDSTGNYGKNNDAQIGDTIEFKATVNIAKNSINVVYHDTMDSQLDWSGVDHVIVYTDSDLTNTLETSHYTVAAGTAPETFTVSFDNDYVAGLTSDTTVYIHYTAVLNDSALVTDEIHNTQHITWGDNGEGTHTTTTTKTYQFILNKTDGATGNLLSGAKFQLFLAETGGNPLTLYKNAAGNEYRLIYDETKVPSGFTSAADNKIETLATSTITITGVDNQTYYLEETDAPLGYNALSGRTAVTPDSTNAVQANIVNNSGANLPTTGGIGTTIFYAVGGLMVLGAAIIMVSRRKAEAR